jgi:hypothetical protein
MNNMKKIVNGKKEIIKYLSIELKALISSELEDNKMCLLAEKYRENDIIKKQIKLNEVL